MGLCLRKHTKWGLHWIYVCACIGQCRVACRSIDSGRILLLLLEICWNDWDQMISFLFFIQSNFTWEIVSLFWDAPLLMLSHCQYTYIYIYIIESLAVRFWWLRRSTRHNMRVKFRLHRQLHNVQPWTGFAFLFERKHQSRNVLEMLSEMKILPKHAMAAVECEVIFADLVLFFFKQFCNRYFIKLGNWASETIVLFFCVPKQEHVLTTSTCNDGAIPLKASQMVFAVKCFSGNCLSFLIGFLGRAARRRRPLQWASGGCNANGWHCFEQHWGCFSLSL